MCLILDKAFDTRQQARDHCPVKIATTNMVVYKAFDRHDHHYDDGPCLVSPYMGFKYELGKTYTAKLGRKIYRRSSSNDWAIRFSRGIHSCLTIYEAWNHKNHRFLPVILRCCIPKGSLYVIGKNYSICSSALTLPKHIKDYG